MQFRERRQAVKAGAQGEISPRHHSQELRLRVTVRREKEAWGEHGEGDRGRFRGPQRTGFESSSSPSEQHDLGSHLTSSSEKQGE